jgi:hypothetical protein
MALTELTDALHSGIVPIISSSNSNTEHNQLKYIVEGKTFNDVVVCCLSCVRPVLDHHLPSSSSSSDHKLTLPSSSKKWGKLKVLIKCYLTDILQVSNS